MSEDEEEDTISYLGYSIDHLAKKMSEVSGIPKEHVRVAKVSFREIELHQHWLMSETCGNVLALLLFPCS